MTLILYLDVDRMHKPLAVLWFFPCRSLWPSRTPIIMISQPVVRLKDLTIDNITKNMHAINSQCTNLRLKFILERTAT